MSPNVIEIAGGLALVALAILLGRRWYRGRPSATLNHSLLASVIREKDAYKR